uniref:Uncharacterized protein n=1 Tax=Anopheles christyi TaxID=43041 RepID=A0A182K0G3_9DIPT
MTLIPDRLFGGEFELLQSVLALGNPLTCGTLEKHRKYIKLGIVIPQWMTRRAEFCSTGSIFAINPAQRLISSCNKCHHIGKQSIRDRATAVQVLPRRWPALTLRMSNNPMAFPSLEPYVQQILY